MSCSKLSPPSKAYGDKITGGTYTSTDESGDARVFTQELAAASHVLRGCAVPVRARCAAPEQDW